MALAQACLQSSVYQIFLEHWLCARHGEGFHKMDIEHVLTGAMNVRKVNRMLRKHIIGEQTYGEGSEKKSLEIHFYPKIGCK